MMHDDAAERAVLGACMIGENTRATFRDAAQIVAAGDWWNPAHAVIWAALEALHETGSPVDPVIVQRMIVKAGAAQRVGQGRPDVYLFELVQQACVPFAVPSHARAIADAAARRRMLQAGQRIAQRAESGEVDAAELTAWAAEEVAQARDARVGVEVRSRSWDEFMHAPEEDQAMIVPGLLGEGDRAVLTGLGGIGKSTLLAQFALCAAAGCPPFDWLEQDPYDPVRTMIWDCENPDYRRRRRYGPIAHELITRFALDPRPNLRIDGTGSSTDLLNPSVALSMLRTIEQDAPRLLYIGPIYKLHNDDPDKEVTVKKITAVLDAVREMGVAIISEGHPNKGSRAGGPMSPSGSGLWEWWPEFGLGLRLDPDSDDIVRRCSLERWRVDREASAWPQVVEASGNPGLPWVRGRLLPTPAAGAYGSGMVDLETF